MRTHTVLTPEAPPKFVLLPPPGDHEAPGLLLVERPEVEEDTPPGEYEEEPPGD